MTPQQFVAKWRHATLGEKQGYQNHFNDLCRLVGHPTPAEADPHGVWFAFEKPATKPNGAKGFADVWKQDCFILEYKGKGDDLNQAYWQLQAYRDDLGNPPLLIVSDMERIHIHTNFTGRAKAIHQLNYQDFESGRALPLLKAIFDPRLIARQFRPDKTPVQVTEEAAREFARLADMLRDRQKLGAPFNDQQAAHFLIRLLFCLFAEDIGLLPDHFFTRLLHEERHDYQTFQRRLASLFDLMRQGNSFFKIPWFNGGLFDNDFTIELDGGALGLLVRASELDWSGIEPSIFGTLFERSLDSSKRKQLGAHYTSYDDIMLIVEPVLMQPYRRRWAEVQAAVRDKLAQRAGREAWRQDVLENEARAVLLAFAGELGQVKVLDPACGSGNFLYVALRQLLDLQHEVIRFARAHGLQPPQLSVQPRQMHGLEINEYAHELAQVTVWIGYIQWRLQNGYDDLPAPILPALDTIERRDAILAFDAAGRPVEPLWPAVDVIIGNPPFLGGNKIRKEVGDRYADSLFTLYNGRIPAAADLVCYWFEKARENLAAGNLKRAGLLSTNSIRGGANRQVLDRIKESGDIFIAWSDRPWVLDGASVRVSIIGFDSGKELSRLLDNLPVKHINSDLTSQIDLSGIKKLKENQGICLRADEKGGPFDIDSQTALAMLSATDNLNGRPNSDVVKRRVNGRDIVQRDSNTWIIDFGSNMSLEEAAQYRFPFSYVEKHVKPVRAGNRIERLREKWWIHRVPGIDMRTAIQHLERYIATPAVAKHRLFVWLDKNVLADHQLYVFARCDDYFFGVLHSSVHEVWALRMGTSLEDRPRYTPTTTFETFPFPWPPGQEPGGVRPGEEGAPRVRAIAEAARDLDRLRQAWLNPPADAVGPAALQKRTLTNLYNALTAYRPWIAALQQAPANQRPASLTQLQAQWEKLAGATVDYATVEALDASHQRLDQAVLAAYGWPTDLDLEAILARLLALNLERAAGQAEGAVGAAGAEKLDEDD